MAKQGRHNLVLVLVALLSLGAICFSVFVLINLKLHEGSLEHKSIHLVIDKKQLHRCPTPKRNLVPCEAGPNEFKTKEGNLGPLRCLDDYYDQEGGVNTCETASDTFHLNGESNAVVVQKPGIYRIYGQVSFKDRSDSAVVVVLRINNYNFVQCHQQNRQPASRNGRQANAPYTTCTVSGERRLREGDRVGLFIPESLRTVNCYRKTTFWGMVRMAD
ncbi:hypothetical protein BOX15_Mlig009154g1 [Macrostomum lignano]|uniref:TNF_2 domain-containing protein n=2 Tax=Macrostomum lignano TaxID=282301 RepID=A0A1I8GNH9_9PLAT|nr:hypothetical protein BOX15_Mlig009154g1 [Macrostomum lignano]